MKKIALFLAVLLPSVTLAESHAGALKLSGQAGYAFSQAKTTADGVPGELTTSVHSARLDGYYLFHANFGAGAWIEYASTTLEAEGVKDSQKSLVAGPALIAELPVSPELSVFAEGAYLFGRDTFPSDGGDVSVDSHGFGLAGGLAWFPVHAVSLDLAARYTNLKADMDGVTTTTAVFGFQAGFSIYFGGSAAGPAREGRRSGTTGAGNPSPW